ncbi:hypothetical protein NQ318_022372 [Aromia moschata]|uniref:Amidase domain-containing protein n=1 Tax=Aromia moschata TaxID=1265417 RepID=A0AAV8Z545_9CUCU|nr:hypothetical protein NQ318_022372 [Aromia moschata]
MSELQDDKKTSKKNRTNVDCSKLKKIMFSIFLFIRYYVDIIIDKAFGYFYDSKKRMLGKCTNPIVLSSAVSLAKKIRKGELKSEQVVQAFIDRIKEVNPILNAMVDTRFNEALAEARRIDKEIEIGSILDTDFQEKPFLGVPFTTKESTAVKGLSWTFGLPKRRGKKASFDADYVALIKNAGAICLGVSNIPQLNLWQETSNPLYGITNNPYDTTRNVGGSSGGESSILAAGGTAISIGTDIGGSCRIPAYMCGMTFRTGKEEQTIVVAGVLARHSEDIASVLKVLVAENEPKLKLDEPVKVISIRVHYILDPRDPFVSPSRNEMKRTMANAVEYFSRISQVKPKQVEFEGTKYGGRLWKYWMSKESNADFKKDIMNREGQVNSILEILRYFAGGGDYTLATIFNFINGLLPMPNEDWAKKETEKLREQILETLKDDGVLLYPSAPWPASYHHTALLRPWNFNLFAIWNVLKFPVTQVPMGLVNGLPVGIQVVAAPYQDRLCIAVARELEREFGGYVPPFQTS